MIHRVNNMAPSHVLPRADASRATDHVALTGQSFALILKQTVDQASRAQFGSIKTLGAVEKNELALNTLIAIRDKLLEALEQIKSMSI